MKKKVLLGVLAAIACIAVIAVFLNRTRAGKDRTLRLYGNVDIRDVNVGFRVNGRVTEVLKDEGDAVRCGEVLARLDDEPYRREVAEWKGRVAAARAKLDLLQAGFRIEEIAQARADVSARKAAMENAKIGRAHV